ncbi:leucine-rich repeat domain-containing protein [Streptococcus rupicaprae]
MATLKAIGFDDDIIQDILHADAPTPFPATETNPENMKAWLATVKSLNIGQRENALKRFGLDLMPNLETLGVGFTKIDDVTPILKFKQLKNLFLTDTGITDYSFLKELPNLEGIDISQNGLTSLDFLKDYPQLKTLAVTGSNLTDISVLSHLPNLESLNLDYNQLTDLTPLANLSKLKVVSLDHNKITDLSALSQKSDLTRLFVSHNEGVKLATLKAPNLEELTAEHSGLTSLGFVRHLPALVSLNASQNAISSLSGLDQAANLRTLNVSENQIASLRLPAGPAKLETLNISHNRLTSLEGIQNFEALDQLNAGHNQLATLSISQPNKSITYLEVNNNHIPAEELEPNEQKIPNGIARYFPSTRGGDISENSVIADDHTDELPTATDDQEQPSPEAELSDIDIKRNYIAKHTNLPADQVVLMETDKGQAFMYPHGNHHHVIYLKDIDVTQPFDDGHGNRQTTPSAPSEPSIPSEPSKPSDQDVAPLPENLEKKRRELAESLGLSTENLRPVTANGKVIGFEYPHEDHYHTILISDEETEKPEHSPEEVKELKAHVRKLYGLLKGTPVSIKNGLVTFAIPHPHQPYDPSIDYYSDEPDPRFDAGHVHPYAVALDRIEIPKKTGNPELDYENELLAFSKLSGIPVSQVKIEKDKFFVLPGHGHDHYINILNAEKGLKAYKENSLPEIKPHLAVGEFSKETIEAELDRIQELAKATFDPESLDYRRILRALDQHRADIDSGTRSSTQAYLDALKDFEKRHVLKETPEPSSEMAENPLEKQYNQLSDQIKKLSDKTLKSYGIDRSALLERLKSAAIDQNKVGIDAIEGYIKAIVRTEAAPNDHLPRVAYMDYFLRHVDSEFLPADLREKVAENILALRKDERNQTFRTQLEQLVALKEQVKQAIAQAQKQPVKLGTSYEEVNKAKTDLVGHVNHWAGIFHYAITDQEKTDGFDRNLQVMPAIKPEANQDDSQPVTTEPVSETPPSDPSGPADSPEKPEKPSVPAPKDTEKEDKALPKEPLNSNTDEEEGFLDGFTTEELEELLAGLNKVSNQVGSGQDLSSPETGITTENITQAEKAVSSSGKSQDEQPTPKEDEDDDEDLFDAINDEDLDAFRSGWEALKKQRGNIDLYGTD